MRFVAGGVEAKALMVGSGQSARQVWPPVAQVDQTLAFNSSVDLQKLPYRGYDGRTDPTSHLVQSIVFGGRISPQGNISPTYEYRLFDQKFNGARLTLEITMPSQAKNLGLPSMLVVAAKTDPDTDLVGVEYGTNGIRVLSLKGSVILHDYFSPYNIAAGSVITVERFLTWIQVFVNGIRIGATQHPTLNLLGQPGVGLYSTTSPSTSTPVGPLKISGGTSLPRLKGGMGYFDRWKYVPRTTTTEIMRFSVPGGGTFRAITRNARWNDMDGYNRNFTLYMNGSSIGTLGGINGTDYVISNPFTVPEDAVFHVTAWTFAAAGADYDYAKIVKSGSVEIAPA